MITNDKDKKIAELEAQIETLKTIIWKMPGNVFWRDANGIYQGCNQNNADMLGLTSSDGIVGKTLSELMDPVSAAVVDKTDFEVMQTGKEVHAEELGFDIAGHPTYYLSHKSPLFNKEGKLTGLLGIALNITDQKRTQELLQLAKKKAEAASRAKSQFLSMISHELRTPLTSILGFIRFLEKDNLSPEEKKECLKHISQSGSYLLSLVNNILDYNKLEAGKLALNHQPMNMKETTKEVISILSGAAKMKSLPLSLEYDDKAPIYFMSDSNAIKQLLINLISNAIKFTEKGHVILKVKNINLTTTTATLQISVEDTGMGIPKDELQAVFKRFHQLDNTYTRANSLTGTGLGLSIVKKLVSLLGSKIELKSTVGEGSTFYFTLTLERDLSYDSVISAHNVAISSSKNPKVLVIEDDHMIQIIHSRMLEELGCQIHLADNAAIALQKLAEPFDLLFVDIGLPDMNGFDLIQSIRKKGYKMPIIALTGFSEDSEQKRCLRAGANNVAIKPVSQSYFEELLRKYLHY